MSAQDICIAGVDDQSIVDRPRFGLGKRVAQATRVVRPTLGGQAGSRV